MNRQDAVTVITAFALGLGAATAPARAQDPRNLLLNIPGFCSTTGIIEGANKLSQGHIGERAKACAAYFLGHQLCTNYRQAANAMAIQGRSHGFTVTAQHIDPVKFPETSPKAFGEFLAARGAAVNASGISDLDALMRMEQWTGRVGSLINQKGGADKVSVDDVVGLIRSDVFRTICPEKPQL